MNFNEQKATAVAAYFLQQAGGQEFYLKLMKLMYLAEREAIRRSNCSITFDRFVSMDHGPVLSRTLDLITPREEIDPARVWREYISLPEAFKVRLIAPFSSEKVLSRLEMAIASDVWQEFGSWDRWELVKHTHGLPEWHDPQGASKPIAFQDVLAGLNLNDEQVKRRYSEHKSMECLDQLLEDAAAE